MRSIDDCMFKVAIMQQKKRGTKMEKTAKTANEIVRENPEILNNPAETPQTTNEDEKGSENAQESGEQAGGQKDAEENRKA